MERKHTTITIPKPLFERIKSSIENTGFSSVSDYVTFVPRQILSSHDNDNKYASFSKKDEEKVKKRLRALGYLD
jgi:hypothetical protein